MELLPEEKLLDYNLETYQDKYQRSTIETRSTV